jgi:hypothetical protein
MRRLAGWHDPDSARRAVGVELEVEHGDQVLVWLR